MVRFHWKVNLTLVKVKSVKVGCKAKAGAHCTAASQPFCPTDWSLGGFSLARVKKAFYISLSEWRKERTQWRKVKDQKQIGAWGAFHFSLPAKVKNTVEKSKRLRG